MTNAPVSVAAVLGAARRRATMALPLGTDVLRLVDDAADGCPGVVVDRFGPVLRLELRGATLPQESNAMATALALELGANAVVARLRSAGGASALVRLLGEVPPLHVVHEAGLRYAVRTADDEAAGAGLFVDQREGRRLVREAARGQVVLNLFAHAGAFGVAAAAGGAARVDHVDLSRRCAQWAALNLALNGVDPRQHRFLVDDALDVLERAARRGPAYGVIVLDPPTTATRKAKGGRARRFRVEDDLPALAAQALAALSPGGLLLVSTNHRGVSVGAVAELVRGAALEQQVTLASVDELPLPVDVPSARDPALRPMRGVTARRAAAAAPAASSRA
ncbi:MAG: class I SAM-dependent methyltransferase [Deltaproteobacteria bacterium]|nr:class I SAM-dependent methyltransferase [Deltaproteobacteria bacterium]